MRNCIFRCLIRSAIRLPLSGRSLPCCKSKTPIPKSSSHAHGTMSPSTRGSIFLMLLIGYWKDVDCWKAGRGIAYEIKAKIHFSKLGVNAYSCNKVMVNNPLKLCHTKFSPRESFISLTISTKLLCKTTHLFAADRLT